MLLESEAFARIRRLEGQDWVHSKSKKWFERAVCLAVTPVVAPIALGAAATIKLVDGGKPFLRQKRYGDFTIEPIEIRKLRTMPGETRHTHSRGPNDLARSELGKFLAHRHIDELPQLADVLAGRIALVGPRLFTYETIEIALDLLNDHERKQFLETGVRQDLRTEFIEARKNTIAGVIDPYAAFAYHEKAEVDVLGMALGHIEYSRSASWSGDWAVIRSAAPLAVKQPVSVEPS